MAIPHAATSCLSASGRESRSVGPSTRSSFAIFFHHGPNTLHLAPEPPVESTDDIPNSPDVGKDRVIGRVLLQLCLLYIISPIWLDPNFRCHMPQYPPGAPRTVCSRLVSLIARPRLSRRDFSAGRSLSCRSFIVEVSRVYYKT